MAGPHDPNNPSGDQYSDDPRGDRHAQYWQPYDQSGYPGFEPNQGGYAYQGAGQVGGITSPVPPHVPQPSLAEVEFRQFDIGDTFSQAWKAFAASWVPWVMSAVLFYAVTFIAIILIWIPLMGAFFMSANGENSRLAAGAFGVSGLVVFLVTIAVGVYGIVWSLNCWRNALRVIRGETIELKDFFKLQGLAKPLVVYLVVGLITIIGFIAFYLPGIAAVFILMFAVPATFHLRDVSVAQAIRTSWQIISRNFGSVLLLFLIVWALNLLGGLVVIGVLVTTPLMHLIFAHALQTSIGGPLIRRA